VHPAVAWGDDDIATLAAGLDQHLLRFGRLVGEFFGGRRPAGELRVGQRRRDAVKQVEPAPRRLLQVAGHDPVEDRPEARRHHELAEVGLDHLGDGPALELEHLESAGHAAGDQTDPGPDPLAVPG
jgi:hypothetical protein